MTDRAGRAQGARPALRGAAKAQAAASASHTMPCHTLKLLPRFFCYGKNSFQRSTHLPQRQKTPSFFAVRQPLLLQAMARPGAARVRCPTCCQSNGVAKAWHSHCMARCSASFAAAVQTLQPQPRLNARSPHPPTFPAAYTATTAGLQCSPPCPFLRPPLQRLPCPLQRRLLP